MGAGDNSKFEIRNSKFEPPPHPERVGATNGRAGFDVVRLMLMRDPCPQGSQNVIPGNLGERFGEMGALKREASNDHL